MEIIQVLNDRVLQSTKPDYEPYVRPEGAFLVGEQTVSINSIDKMELKFYPNPVVDALTINHY